MVCELMRLLTLASFQLASEKSMNANTTQAPGLFPNNSDLVKKVEQRVLYPIVLTLMFAGTLMPVVSVVQAVV